MGFNIEKAIKILTDELNYAYCDNCWFAEDETFKGCDDCHRKYQNWALAKHTAEEIINKILKEC